MILLFIIPIILVIIVIIKVRQEDEEEIKPIPRTETKEEIDNARRAAEKAFKEACQRETAKTTTNNNKSQSYYYTNKNYTTKTKTQTDYRQQHPKPFRCKSGLEVRSKSEREIADFFFENDIKFIYESEYFHPYTKRKAIPDFYLPRYNLYIEYFGRSDEKYIQSREEKIKMYRSDPYIKFAYLTYNDDYDLIGKLKEICHNYNMSLKQ